MDWFVVVASVLFLLGVAVAAWGFHTNTVTLEQRQALVDAIFKEPYSPRRRSFFLTLYNKVEYDAHADAVLWGRNPWKLYDPRLTALIGK